jgi:hypothetical protein
VPFVLQGQSWSIDCTAIQANRVASKAHLKFFNLEFVKHRVFFGRVDLVKLIGSIGLCIAEWKGKKSRAEAKVSWNLYYMKKSRLSSILSQYPISGKPLFQV